MILSVFPLPTAQPSTSCDNRVGARCCQLLQKKGYSEYTSWLLLVGQPFDSFYWTMPAGDLEVALLTSDVWAQPSRSGQHFDVGVRSLRQAKGPFGTIYYSPHEPRVTIDGQSYIVGLTRHAIERIYDRSGYSWRTFTGHGDASRWSMTQGTTIWSL